MSTDAELQALDSTEQESADAPQEVAGKSPLRIAFGRLMRDKIAVVCLIVVAFFYLVALLSGVIQRAFGVDTEIPLGSFLQLNGVPLPEYGPPDGGFTMDHPFGIAPRTATDNLAYWVEGARNSLQIATLSTVVATLLGITMGLLSGFLGGMVDRIVSFLTDFFLTLPFILAALTIAPIINERFRDNQEHYTNIQVASLIMVLALFGWMGLAHLIRGELLSLREREFIQAARVIGMPTSRILLKELLPNLVAPIVVSVSLMLPAFVAAEAGLAYLGIGVTSRPSWGQTLVLAQSFFKQYPLYLFQPLLGIVALVLSLNLLGDAIRDALDPKTRR